MKYSGNYFIQLSEQNSITFTPNYSFSHTAQHSAYSEHGFSPICNAATDNTNQLSGRLNYYHDFGKYGSFSAYCDGSYDYYRTRYSGSATSLDKSKDIRVTVGASYDLYLGNLYGSAGFGWDWDKLKVNNVRSKESSPFANLALQYLFKKQHKLSTSFSYSVWKPNPSFKSENIIKANHLMSYTGNPHLVPCKTFEVDLNYSWIPSKNYSLTVFGSMWTVKDRYVYDYEASSDGVLRTIKQPMGNYMIGNYGVSGSTSFFDRNLRISGSLYQEYAHNGNPYNYTRFPIIYALRASYYIGNFYILGSFSSRNCYSDGYMVGTWMEYKNSYQLQAGWSNSKWNIRVSAKNFARWGNWCSHKAWFSSKYYDSSAWHSDVDSHAFFSLSATYTFSYGKKIKNDGEPGSGGSASSGILKQ